MGYDHDRAGAVPIYGIRIYDKDGSVKEDVDMDLKPRFGADCLAQKRSDLRDELMRLMTTPPASLGIKGNPVRMVFDTAVVALEAEEGIVLLSNGSKATADVVIGEYEESCILDSNEKETHIDAVADGVHSRLRASVVGNDSYVAKKTGLTCYRVAVSVEDAKKTLSNVPLPHWMEPSTCQNRSSIIYAGDGSARIVTVYPLRHQTYFNLSCILQTEESSKSTTELWHADGDRAKMVESFSDFQDPLVKILG